MKNCLFHWEIAAQTVEYRIWIQSNLEINYLKENQLQEGNDDSESNNGTNQYKKE